MENKKTLIIHHSADFDGLFCGAIAKKFIPHADVIGWDFGDNPITNLQYDEIYVLDLPVDRPFGITFDVQMPLIVVQTGDYKYRFGSVECNNIIWIDHHKTSIQSHPTMLMGYRIDGVAACRLTWQWFNGHGTIKPTYTKQAFIDRQVDEPWAVRLAGEYDIWDKRDPDAEIFQFGLRSQELGEITWSCLLSETEDHGEIVHHLLTQGKPLQRYQREQDASLVKHRAFIAMFEGLKFLMLNTGRGNSLTFTSIDKPENGHDALCIFAWGGTKWTFSLYHANHRKDLDLSTIAKKYGGGGHPGACGFQAKRIPFEALA